MTEEWRAVVGYEGLYEVSSLGRVRSLDRRVRGLGRTVVRRGKVLSASPNNSGYLFVSLSKGGHRANGYVHRLALNAFVGPSNGRYACHGDGVKTNNRIENLRWDTPQANAQDSIQHGTNAGNRRTECAKGHPYDAENTGVRRSGHRWCRTCNREAMRARVETKEKAA